LRRRRQCLRSLHSDPRWSAFKRRRAAGRSWSSAGRPSTTRSDPSCLLGTRAFVRYLAPTQGGGGAVGTRNESDGLTRLVDYRDETTLLASIGS
jgi:hypothetical protein